MPSELELKLEAKPDILSKIKELRFPGAESQDEWVELPVNNTYFDTENFKLREANIGMRIRQIGQTYVQTVKSSGKIIGGLHQQNEDEAELPAPQLDTSLITEPYLQILIEEAEAEDGPFLPIFETNFTRSQCQITFSDNTIIEVVLDRGEIKADEQTTPICEVELELIEGSAEYLFAIGRYLIKDFDLKLSNSSKARRGYALCRKISTQYNSMQVVEMSQGIEAEKAFEQICFSALKHWQYYELFLEKDNAHKAVLEMYRALIYLQHMYMVFGGLIPRRATEDLRNNWNWLAEAMRPIVDAAKHLRYLNQYLKQKADWDLVETQTQKIKAEAVDAIESFKTLLATQRYNLMMLNMSQWLYFKEWRSFIEEKKQDQLKTPIIDFARKQLEHVLKELKRDLGPKVTLEYKDYFKLIAKIRRALDTGLFFGGLFDSKQRVTYRQPWIELIECIRELQMNDYIFELQLETHDKTETEEWLESRNQPVLERLIKIRKKVFKSNPYWG